MISPRKPRLPRFLPQSKRREDDMTLCIAATVRHMEDESIGDGLICCFDVRVEAGHSTSDTGAKFRRISKEWCGMLAGDIQKADRLLDLMRFEFREKTIDSAEAMPELRRVVAAYKAELVDEYTRNTVALSYSELRNASQSMPPSIYLQVIDEVTRISIGCELILMNLRYKTPYVYQVGMGGQVDQVRNFCAIGSGATNAESWLHYREQSPYKALSTSVVSVYEAKKFAEHAPGVSKTTKLLIFGPYQRVRFLQSFSTLDQMWAAYGPRIRQEDQMNAVLKIEDYLDAQWENIIAD